MQDTQYQKDRGALSVVLAKLASQTSLPAISYAFDGVLNDILAMIDSISEDIGGLTGIMAQLAVINAFMVSVTAEIAAISASITSLTLSVNANSIAIGSAQANINAVTNALNKLWIVDWAELTPVQQPASSTAVPAMPSINAPRGSTVAYQGAPGGAWTEATIDFFDDAFELTYRTYGSFQWTNVNGNADAYLSLFYPASPYYKISWSFTAPFSWSTLTTGGTNYVTSGFYGVGNANTYGNTVFNGQPVVFGDLQALPVPNSGASSFPYVKCSGTWTGNFWSTNFWSGGYVNLAFFFQYTQGAVAMTPGTLKDFFIRIEAVNKAVAF